MVLCNVNNYGNVFLQWKINSIQCYLIECNVLSPCFIYSNTEEVVKSMDEVYSVGTFVKIHEVQMIENGKMVMIAMGHRRFVLLLGPAALARG